MSKIVRHNRKYFYFIGLLLSNLIWALNPVIGKTLLADFSPLQVVWLRYVSGLIALFALGAALAPRFSPILQRPRGRQIKSLLVIALLTFWIGPCLQIIGLSFSQATINAIIIAMEPIMTVIVAWFVVGDRLKREHVFFFALSLVGFVLLSGLASAFTAMGSMSGLMVFGNILMLVSLVGEACYSSFSRILLAPTGGARAYNPMSAMATPLLIAVALMTLVLCLPVPGAGFPMGLTAKHWLAVLWLGPLATAGGYLFWILALKHLSIPSMVLTLFVQPLAGALFGAVFLGETLTHAQLVGGTLIFASVVLQQAWELRRPAPEIKA